MVATCCMSGGHKSEQAEELLLPARFYAIFSAGTSMRQRGHLLITLFNVFLSLIGPGG
jgi:hypothetical protein